MNSLQLTKPPVPREVVEEAHRSDADLGVREEAKLAMEQLRHR